MKQLLLLHIFIIFLLLACGDNSTDKVQELETEDTAHHEDAANHTHPHADDVEETSATQETDTNYAFKKSQYKYKDGHIVLTWADLARVTFEEDYDETVEEYIMRPIFSDTLQALDGKPIMVEGFVIPIEETGDETFIVLSGVPYLQCFFCGGAGPETVIDILPKNKLKKRLKTDAKTIFKGKLRLNADDLDYLNYILDDAELVN